MPPYGSRQAPVPESSADDPFEWCWTLKDETQHGGRNNRPELWQYDDARGFPTPTPSLREDFMSGHPPDGTWQSESVNGQGGPEQVRMAWQPPRAQGQPHEHGRPYEQPPPPWEQAAYEAPPPPQQ